MLKAIWAPILLILISILLCFLNYQPGTYLSGWDNLHPEFNFAVNLKRSVDTLWQEYQSTGLLGGMAHAADLPRQLILYLLSTIYHQPANLRYFWTFLMLIIGPLGVYFLAKSTLLKKFSPLTQSLAGFFAGLFNLLNLATVQSFYTPFEAFISFFGFLPWLLLSTILFLEKPNTKHYVLLTITLILAAPGFYIQTLFLVFAICLIPILVAKIKNLRSVILYLVILLTTQAYWLLPAVYFSLTSSSTTVNSVQNLVATPEIIVRNQEYGNFSDIALLKGFWFRYNDLGPNDQFAPLLGPWVDHLNNPAIVYLGFALFALILIGVLYSLRHRLKFTLPFTLIFIISILFLTNYELLTNNFELLHQSFRSVYTKWSIPAGLIYSLFFGVSVVFLLELFKELNEKLTIFITCFSLIFALIAFSGPSFSGHLIYPAMRVKIPDNYFQLFDFFKNQDPNTRIANFPQNTFWGWQFYQWPCPAEILCEGKGYRGSGFLWYGLNQPVLDRAFDVWSPFSEQYYNDVKFAVYGENLAAFETVLEKYSISWLLVDRSIIAPGAQNQDSLYLDQLKKLISRSSKINLIKTFDFIDVYAVDLSSHPQNFLSSSIFPSPYQGEGQGEVKLLLSDTSLKNHSVNREESKNCDPLAIGTHAKKITQTETIYTAKGTNACDHFLYPSLQLNKPYQIKIESKNLAGAPLLYCLEPYPAKVCLLYGYVNKSSDFSTTTLNFPTLNPDTYGFTLHLYNQSLGNQFTQNSLKSITISSPSPYQREGPGVRSAGEGVLSTMRILDSHHPTFSLYTTKVTASENSRLILNQSFDSGWKAFIINEHTFNQSTWILYLKSLMLIPLPENTHQIANSWANSWIIPEGTHYVLLVYLPQHLQYLGFSLLLVPFVLFVLLTRH